MNALIAYLLAPITEPHEWINPHTGNRGVVDVPVTGCCFIVVNRRADGSSPGWPPSCLEDDRRDEGSCVP